MRALLTAALLTATTISANAQTLVINEQSCRRLVRHVPAPDVAYQPGVDVRGRPVVAADLGGAAPILFPEVFEIPITIELADRLGIPVGGNANFTADVQVGTVTVDGRGRTTFNGQPLTNDAEFALAEACQEIARER